MTRAGESLAVFALVFGLGCADAKQDSSSEAAPVAPPAPAAPAVQPAPEPPPKAPTALDLPPLKLLQADGITITEIADGSVNVKTTTLWNEPMDTTYQTCDYYRGALPVLKRQLAKDRGLLLDQACAKAKKKK